MLADARARGGLPLLEAASREDLQRRAPAGRAHGARRFRRASSRRLRERAQDASVDELLQELDRRDQLREYLQAEGPESARDRIENVRELINGAAETVVDDGGEVGLTPLDHFLQRATLVAGVDALDPDADAVTLMTLHNAKGLEFPVVFITGLEDGLFPLAQAFDDPPKLEEERRLFYVGITRAEEKLYLSFTEKRRRNGELLPSIRSSFLTEIAAANLEEKKTIAGRARWGVATRSAPAASVRADSTPGRTRRGGTPRRSGRARNVGDRRGRDVAGRAALREGRARQAQAFGSGTIAELSGVGREVKANIDFDDETIGRKTLVLAYTHSRARSGIMAVTRDDVRHIAALARLGIDAARADELTRELNAILAHMEVLSQVDTESVSSGR